MTIYHFANRGYGLPFINLYKSFSGHICASLDITVVFAKSKIKRDKFYYLRKLKRDFQNWKSDHNDRKEFRDHPFKILFAEDVNNVKFLRQIPEGSIGICSGFNQIFSRDLINRFEVCLNFHPSILPYYRGPVPSFWVLHNREYKSGITLHRMTEKIDQGEILYQEVINIKDDDTESSLDTRIALKGAEVLKEYILTRLAGKTFQPRSVKASTVYRLRVYYKSFPKDF